MRKERFCGERVGFAPKPRARGAPARTGRRIESDEDARRAVRERGEHGEQARARMQRDAGRARSPIVVVVVVARLDSIARDALRVDARGVQRRQCLPCRVV